MIVGVDVGGTKTLLAVFTESGKLLDTVRFATNHDYNIFLQDLAKNAQAIRTSKAKIASAALPGLLDRKRGVVHTLGNLPWQDKYVAKDIAEAIGVERVSIENDSKLAGLAEARLILSEYKRSFYVTLSTGINGGLIINGKLSKDVIDAEIGKTPMKHKGKIVAWEEFASGRAFYNQYQQKASEVNDPVIWEEFAANVVPGLGMICASFQPEVIIFGGSLGQLLGKFEAFLTPYLEKYLHPNVRQPKALLAAQLGDDSVIYGCYHHAKDRLA